MILTPNCDIKKIENLTTILPKCVVKTLEELYEIKTTIKEPNDIYLNGKKLGGILTESKCQGTKVKKIFIGVGLDINQEEFPKELKDVAISLKQVYGKEFSKEEIFIKFLEIFEKEYLKMLND